MQPMDMTLAHLQDTREYLHSREEAEGKLRHSTDTYFIDKKNQRPKLDSFSKVTVIIVWLSHD